jgi:hypothetical protein
MKMKVNLKQFNSILENEMRENSSILIENRLGIVIKIKFIKLELKYDPLT